jgi:hypothetical protein
VFLIANMTFVAYLHEFKDFRCAAIRFRNTLHQFSCSYFTIIANALYCYGQLSSHDRTTEFESETLSVMRLANRGSFPVVAPPKSTPKSSSAPKPDDSLPTLLLFPFPFLPSLSKSASASARASATSSLLRRLRPPAQHTKRT